MDFLEFCQQRYSERKFDARPVEEEKLLRILEADCLVPTACNYQPQRIYVLNKKDILSPVHKATYHAPKSLIPSFQYSTPLYPCREGF